MPDLRCRDATSLDLAAIVALENAAARRDARLRPGRLGRLATRGRATFKGAPLVYCRQRIAAEARP